MILNNTINTFIILSLHFMNKSRLGLPAYHYLQTNLKTTTYETFLHGFNNLFF